MMNIFSLRFKWFIVWWLVLSSFITLVLAGSAIFVIRRPDIDYITGKKVEATARELAIRVEGLLNSAEQSLVTLTGASLLLDPDKFSRLVVTSMASQPLVRRMYFLNEDARIFAVWPIDKDNPRESGMLGIDFSYTPLYRSLSQDGRAVWSDKFVSLLAGDTSIGVGVKIGKHAAIAEIDLSTLLRTVETASDSDARLLVVDRQGELLADTGSHASGGVLNIKHEPPISMSLRGEPLPPVVTLFGKEYYPAVVLSKQLGWLFLAFGPAGFQNPLIKSTIANILLLSGAFFLIAMLLVPVWSYVIGAQLASLRSLAEHMATERDPPDYEPGGIAEFNDLAKHFMVMAQRVAEREDSLLKLNQELEQRVGERTRELETSNQELTQLLESNNKMHSLLVETEKLAALGRLVAGVAHELNTPVGNAVMAISTLKEEQKVLDKAMGDGLRKSDLDRFLSHLSQGLDIAGRNIDRAAELIVSFKHVASDQASSVRRKFELSEMIREVTLTLQPMLKRSPHTLISDLGGTFQMDSYPGVLGQILTNLINNALLHAWEEGIHGTITLNTLESPEPGRVLITVADDGKGIPEELRKKIFEPFFTTKMGQGGTGLGLNIAYNGARNVLGGYLEYRNGPRGGTVFQLDIPLVAPVMSYDI